MSGFGLLLPWLAVFAAGLPPELRALDELGNIVQIDAGGYYTCVVDGSGAAMCWGNNASGSLGDGTTVNRSAAVGVSGLSAQVSAVATGFGSCALTTGGGVQCWGVWYGLTPIWRAVSGFASISIGLDVTCGVTTAGGVKCWGGTNPPSDVPELSSGVAAVSAGGHHVCAVTVSGAAKCWGNNYYGALGNGTTSDRWAGTPVDVSGLTSGVAAISAGYLSTCALTTAGGAKCWGANGSGQLGDGTTTTRLTPVDVVGLSAGVSAISTSDSGGGSTGGHTCAITASGSAKCWGANDFGQLGDGTTTPSLVPVDVQGLGFAPIAIAVGGTHSCALSPDGRVKCWGDNRFGQVGDGSAVQWRSLPATVLAAAPQTLSFPPLSDRRLGEDPFVVSATASSGLPVTFTSLTDYVCRVSGSTVTLVAMGTCTVAADQPGDGTVAAAPRMTQSFSVGAPSLSLSIVAAGTGSGTVTSTPAGIDCGSTCSAGYAPGTVVVLSATPSAGSLFAGWYGGGCSGMATCAVSMAAATTVTATFATLAAVPTATAVPAAMTFPGQSMGTTSPAQAVSIVNTGTGTLAIDGVTTTEPQFRAIHDCTSLATGSSCTVWVSFSPAPAAGELLGTTTVSGALSIASNGTGAPNTVPLSGTGEKSLVTHYYRSILRRAPDAAGKAYWESEALRVNALVVDVNEVWFAMAQQFYSSAEYLAFNRDNAGFVTDLYNTFFNRLPEADGLAYWTGLISAGMPREVALTSFMFSPEFTNFARAIFGDTSGRKEVDTVVDFYRGFLSRLPDTGGFGYWLQKFREAQCQGATAVTAQVEAISSAFAQCQEYMLRHRSNSQYVGDLYNAFLRRGGDLEGVAYWIGQLDTGARSRENVRRAFVASPEFQARVAAIIAQGCLN